MKRMADCKWCQDEFCVNDLCPMCADYCPVPNDPGVCRWEERGMVEVVRCKDCEYWRHEFEDVGLCKVDVPDVEGVERCADDFCSYGERKADV